MKYLLILLLFISPLAFAHDDDDRTPITQVIPIVGHNDNHNNVYDNSKHVAEAVVITGAVWCAIHKCWRQDAKTIIHFNSKQGLPDD